MSYGRIATATLVAGTLDIASAILLTLARGGSVERMLAGIASGPFGDRMLGGGIAAALCGLLVHFGLMAIMVFVFAWLATGQQWLLRHPVVVGIGYGLAIYAVMYWLVIPLRWPEVARPLTFEAIAIPVAIHIALVGIPIALLITGRGSKAEVTLAVAQPEAARTGD